MVVHRGLCVSIQTHTNNCHSKTYIVLNLFRVAFCIYAGKQCSDVILFSGLHNIDLGLGYMAKKKIMVYFFTSSDLNSYHKFLMLFLSCWF